MAPEQTPHRQWDLELNIGKGYALFNRIRRITDYLMVLEIVGENPVSHIPYFDCHPFQIDVTLAVGI